MLKSIFNKFQLIVNFLNDQNLLQKLLIWQPRYICFNLFVIIKLKMQNFLLIHPFLLTIMKTFLNT